jgi:hypothetical protein
MFQTLLSHPQEELNKRQLVYCVRVMSVGCTKIGVEPVTVRVEVLLRWFHYTEIR